MIAAGTPVCSRNALSLWFPLDQCSSRSCLLVQLCQRSGWDTAKGDASPQAAFRVTSLQTGPCSCADMSWRPQSVYWALSPGRPHLPKFAAYRAMEHHLIFASHPQVVLKYVRFLAEVVYKLYRIGYSATNIWTPTSTTLMVAFPLTQSEAKSYALGRTNASWPACLSTNYAAPQIGAPG